MWVRSEQFLRCESQPWIPKTLLARHLTQAQVAIGPQLSQTLDVGRWSAALLVLLYHAHVNVFADHSLQSSTSLADAALVVLGSCGQQAVYWFFVISGFLVGGTALVDVDRSRFAMRRFVLHRFSRVYIVLIPALIVGLCFDLLRVKLYGINAAAGGEMPASYSLVTIFGNALLVNTIFVPSLGSNIPLWSLANEAWYYVFFACLIAILFTVGQRSRWIGISVLGAALCTIGEANYHVIALFPLWLIGVAARFITKPLMRSMGLAWTIAIIITAAYPYTVPVLRSGNYVLVALAFANVLVTAMHSARVPNPRYAHWQSILAGFSFSLYCTHAPIIHFFMSLVNGRGDPRLQAPAPDTYSVSVYLALCATCIAFAYAFSLITEERTKIFRNALGSFFRN